MSKDTPEIAAARIEAERAWAQLIDTARRLQDELLDLLSPHNLARDIWDGAKEKGADLAEEAVDAVRKRPAIASGVVAALALFFAREPLIDMAGKLAKGVQTKRKASRDKPKADKSKAGKSSAVKPRASKPRPPKTQPRKPTTRQKTTETIE
jgi:hypothetical protein